MNDLSGLLAATRQTNALTAAVLDQAAAILTPEPDPAAVLAAREVPALMPAELVDAACREAPSKRSQRTAAHRRHRAKVAKIRAAHDCRARRIAREAALPCPEPLPRKDLTMATPEYPCDRSDGE